MGAPECAELEIRPLVYTEYTILSEYTLFIFLLYTITGMCVEEKTSDSRNKKYTFILSILYATIKSILHISFSREFS